MKKAKRMTQREKDQRAEAREDLRALGLIPPRKKPLNRKKFVTEALDEYQAAGWKVRERLPVAMAWVLNRVSPGPEDVGAAKVLKVAAAIVAFEEKLKEDKRDSYPLEELHEYLKPILEA